MPRRSSDTSPPHRRSLWSTLRVRPASRVMASHTCPVPAGGGTPPTVGSTGEEEAPAGWTSAEPRPLLPAEQPDRRTRRVGEKRGRRTPGHGLLDRSAGGGIQAEHP